MDETIRVLLIVSAFALLIALAVPRIGATVEEIIEALW